MFQAFAEIGRRVASSPDEFRYGALHIDGLSIREAVEFLSGPNRHIGYVDSGGLLPVSSQILEK